MGREAACHCNWGGESADSKVLLESNELIVRGSIRRRVPIASLTQVSVRADQLCFRAGQDEVTLTLGPEVAQSWARKIATPPPTLASKLGIGSESRVLILGEPACEELEAALAEAGTRTSQSPDLIVASVGTHEELGRALQRAIAYTTNPPIWIVYRKGSRPGLKSSELPEAAIRNTLRGMSFIDTKVASVSATHTALRFIRRA